MADLDTSLVAALVAGGQPAFRQVVDSGFTSDLLEGDGQRAYLFFSEYLRRYGSTPSDATVLAETGVLLPLPTDPIAYLVDAVQDRAVHKVLHAGLEEIAGALSRRDPKGGRALTEDLLRRVRGIDRRGALVESLPALGPAVISYYEKIKSGERGILTPWPSVNEATLGLWPEDLVLFVARLSTGKTWALVMIAGIAWEGRIRDAVTGQPRATKVLVATTEMTKERLAMRYLAWKLRLHYYNFTHGRLDSFEEQKLRDGVQSLMALPNLNVVGGDFDLSMETLSGIVMDEKPDLLIVDGAYLLKVPGITRTEKAANVFDELKRIAKRSKAAVVVSSQFNRDAVAGQSKTADPSNIALTDVAGWNADLIFGLVQSEEMRKVGRMAIKPLKTRETVAHEIETNWDMDRMDFSEIPAATGPGAAVPTPSGVPVSPASNWGNPPPDPVDLF